MSGPQTITRRHTKAMRSIRHKVRDAVAYDDLYSLEENVGFLKDGTLVLQNLSPLSYSLA